MHISLEKRPYEMNQASFWKVTIGLTLASLLNFANLYIVQPLLPVFAREFNVSPTVSSFALSLTTLSLVVGLLVFGFLSDRIGRIGILHWTLFLSVIPTLMIPLTDSFIWIIILRFFTGIAIAGVPAVAIAYINEEINYKSRGLAVTFYIASNALGGMIGRVIGGYFADHFRWQTGFYTVGFLGIIICFLCVILLPKSRFFEDHNRRIKEDLIGMIVHLKNKKLVLAFQFGMMLQFSFTGVWTYIPFYLEKEPFLLSIHAISLVYFTYLFGVVGSPIAGRLSFRLGYIKLMVIGLLIMLSGIVVTLAPTTFWVTVGLSLVCLGFFIVHSLTSAWVAETATHHKSGAMSFYLLSYYAGVTVGGTAAGVIWSGFSWPGVVTACTVVPAISGMLFLANAKSNANLKHENGEHSL